MRHRFNALMLRPRSGVAALTALAALAAPAVPARQPQVTATINATTNVTEQITKLPKIWNQSWCVPPP